MKSANPIHLLERDYFLHLDRSVPVWPPENLDLLDPTKFGNDGDEASGNWLTGEWNREELPESAGGYLWRTLEESPGRNDTRLFETILRFPSAPLFGSQSKTGYQVEMKPVHQHTMRFLRSPTQADEPKITKIFLMFNGLNELDRFDFYYDLAGLLIGKSNEVACLIIPFPAHLTRYPMIGKFAERPLQRFITDPSDLFRQYLRFMVEMQWLMSALVPVSDYPVTTGIPLLGESTQPNEGRCNTKSLSKDVHEAWKTIFDCSERGNRGYEVAQADVQQSISVVRHLIGWTPSDMKLVDRKIDDPLNPPQIHAIGYSLGGYLAQSTFFSWPYAIASCSTLCSGGALHDLRPEKIIHQEEWRAITHGLKYEVDSGMLEGRIALNEQTDRQFVNGIPVSLFASHFRTFHDIFLQDSHGTYGHRVSEFTSRMFFVVGGNDPIVPTRTVLDTSPPEGINMIEIANLSHFLGVEKGEWTAFWLPTIAGIISALADRSEKLLRTTMLANLWNEETTDVARGDSLAQRHASGALKRASKSAPRDSEPLNSDRIQTAITRLVERLEKNSVLLVLRNQIPVTLMGERVLHRRGSVPHYADFEIRQYWERLQQQRLSMLKSAPQVTIVVPGRLNDWLKQRLSILSDKHLPVVREFSEQDRQERIWEDFLRDWDGNDGALYRFNPEYPQALSSPRFQLEQMIREDTATPAHGWVVNCLPDVWISLSEKAVDNLAGADAKREEILTKFIERMSRIYRDRRRKKRREPRVEDERKATERIDEWIRDGVLEVIRVSPAQSSPRFLGEKVWSPQIVGDLLMHSALALARSRPCPNKGDFAKGWIEETAK
jgi:pimeloyl-ACP methyl ester carboxylesterase